MPMTKADLDKVFAKAIRLADGRYRASASLFLAGKPIGPFRYEETRDDDPNDIIAHEDRRELRASQVLAAWTNHFDAREQNTLDTFVTVEGKGGYIQHNILDFGDCFGSIWEPPMMGRRIGHSHYFAADHIFEDFITLGLIKRPWDENRFGPSGKVFAYYKVADYHPSEWRPGYPNPAMLRMTERDAAWMARIVARMTPAHVKAMIASARIQDPAIEKELTRIVLGRRQRTLGRYLSRVSALTDPTVLPEGGGASLCVDDRGVSGETFPLASRKYGARAFVGDRLEPTALAPTRLRPRLCVQLPPVPGATPKVPGYLIVDLYAWTGSETRVPARVHLYHLGGGDYRVVGLERPYHNDPPKLD